MSFTFPEPVAVCLDLLATDRESLIRTLAAPLATCEDVVDYDSFLQQIIKREVASPSALGNACALPHVRTSAVEEIVLVVGRSTQPLDFEAEDGEGARLFFLFGVPEHCITQYLKLVARLSSLLKDAAFRQALLEAKDEEAVQGILESARS